MTSVAAALGTVTAGLYFWWSYLWGVPPPVQGLIVLAAFSCVFFMAHAVALVGHRYFRRPSTHPFYPVAGTLRIEVPRALSVTVFTHDEAIAANRDLPRRVAALFQEAGWNVQEGRTNLQRHAHGIWIHGGSRPERGAVIWGLSSLNLKPQIDDSAADNHPLQVIVGAVAISQESAAGGTVPTNTAVPPASAPAIKQQQQEPKLRSVSPTSPPSLNEAFFRAQKAMHQASVLPITLKWGEHSNGLTIRGFGTSPDLLMNVRCVVIDIRKWSDEHGVYAAVAELYPGGVFQELLLTGQANLGLGDSVDFGSIHLGPERLEIHGQGDRRKISQYGVWRISCRIETADGSKKSVHHLCLSWNPGTSPFGWKCPEPKTN